MTKVQISAELKILSRIAQLLEAVAKTVTAEKLAKAMSEPKLRVLYESTGHLSVRELAKRTGFSVGKISGIWSQWEQDGLLVKEGSSYSRVL